LNKTQQKNKEKVGNWITVRDSQVPIAKIDQDCNDRRIVQRTLMSATDTRYGLWRGPAERDKVWYRLRYLR